MLSYLKGEQGRGQQVRDVDGHWRTSPVTLDKHMEARDSQGHHYQLPVERWIIHTLNLVERDTEDKR